MSVCLTLLQIHHNTHQRLPEGRAHYLFFSVGLNVFCVIKLFCGSKNVQSKQGPQEQVEHRDPSIPSSHRSLSGLFLIMRLVKRSSSVMSPQICCGLWSWQRSHLWTEASFPSILVGLRSHGRNCWGVTHRTDCRFDFVKACSSALRHPDLQDSLIQACFSISYPLLPPKFSSLLLITFNHQWHPKSLNFTL